MSSTVQKVTDLVQRNPKNTAVASAILCAVLGVGLLALAASKIQFKTMDVIQPDGQWQFDRSVMIIGDGSFASHFKTGTLLFLGGAALGVALSQLRKAKGKKETQEGETKQKTENLQTKILIALIVAGLAIAFLWARTSKCMTPPVFYDEVGIQIYPPPYLDGTITGTMMSRSSAGLALLGLAAGGAGLAHYGMRWLGNEEANSTTE